MHPSTKQRVQQALTLIEQRLEQKDDLAAVAVVMIRKDEVSEAALFADYNITCPHLVLKAILLAGVDMLDQEHRGPKESQDETMQRLQDASTSDKERGH